MYTDLIRIAASRARNFERLGFVGKETESAAFLASVARIAWSNDCRAATCISAACEPARKMLKLENGRICIRNPNGFTVLYKKVRKAEADSALAAANNESAGKQQRNSRSLARLCKLWSPLDKRMVLAVAKLEGGQQVSSEGQCLGCPLVGNLCREARGRHFR